MSTGAPMGMAPAMDDGKRTGSPQLMAISPMRTALWTVVPMQWSLRAFAWSIDFLNGNG